MELGRINNSQSFGMGVKISSEIGEIISKKPQFMQKHYVKSLAKMDEFSNAHNLDIHIKRNYIVNNIRNISADYISKNNSEISGSVIQEGGYVDLGTFSSLKRKIARELKQNNHIESLKKFISSEK